MKPKNNPSKLSIRKAYSEQLREKQKARDNKKLIKVDGKSTKKSLNKATSSRTKTNIKGVKSLKEEKCHLNILFEESNHQKVQLDDKSLRKNSKAQSDKPTRCIKPPKNYQSIKSNRKSHKSITLKSTIDEKLTKNTQDTLKYQYRIYDLEKKLER